jgi:hypothetical protein
VARFLGIGSAIRCLGRRKSDYKRQITKSQCDGNMATT